MKTVSVMCLSHSVCDVSADRSSCVTSLTAIVFNVKCSTGRFSGYMCDRSECLLTV